MHITRYAAVLSGLVLLAAADCSKSPSGPEDLSETTLLDFMIGSWDVTSQYTLSDGSVEETTGTSTVRASVSGMVLKEVYQGTRDGVPVQVETMFARSVREYVLARGDGGAGTMDILRGSFQDGQAVFTTFAGTRPTGGKDRLIVIPATNDAFEVRAERNPTGTGAWETYWVMQYQRRSDTPAEETITADCGTEHHQFDFWLGDWKAADPGGSIGGYNHLKSRLGGCILEENWLGGEVGTSFNMYDVRTGLWYQLWKDSTGTLLVIQGGLDTDGRMVMEGANSAGNPGRIIWTDAGPSAVRQVGQFSNDGGASWLINYNYLYTPR